MDQTGYLCVFVKPPVPGRAKTRLIPALGAGLAASLAEAMFQDTWCQIQHLPWAKPIVASVEPISRNGLVGADAEVWLQGDGDLGARLERIFRKGLENAPFTIALGADSPGLPVHILDRARVELRSADAVIGPCEDGGFFLLGLRRCPPGLLNGIPWSRPYTFAGTVRRLLEAGLKVQVLDPWFDIDRPEDLQKLSKLLTDTRSLAPNTARVLDQIASPAPGGWKAARRCEGSRNISVVIPVLNELGQLPVTLARLQALNFAQEVAVVDGGSSDGTREWLASQPVVRVLDSECARGPQLNAGARVSRGEILLFLHADCWLPAGAAASIQQAMERPDVVAGAFHVRFAEERPASLRVVAGGINWRTGLCRCATGDQAIFVRRSAFEQLGGFAEWPLFEDVDLVARLKRLGRFVILPSTVTISARRYLAWGVWRTVLTVYLLRLGYWLGVSPLVLEKWFRVAGQQPPKASRRPAKKG